MNKYLIHYLTNGTPVGVWDSEGSHYYNPESHTAQAYGEKVLEDANFSDWESLLELWDGKTPNGTARWGSVESQHLILPIVLEEVIQDSER